MDIGRKIAKLRKDSNMSQQELANKLNVSNKTISKWECGNSIPDIESLNILADIFNVSLDFFVDKSNNEEYNNLSNVPTKNRSFTKQNYKKIGIISSVIVLAILTIIIPVLCYCLIPRVPKIESSSLFTIDETNSTISCSVSNDTENFSFSDTFKVTNNNSWKLYYDITGTLEINSKTVSLEIGNNIFYVLVENKSGKKKVYSAIVRRRPMYTVNFTNYGNTPIQSQIIEEGSFAMRPTETPIKRGYTFLNWDYDFFQPVTKETTVRAVYKANTYKIIYHSNDKTDTTIEQNVTFDSVVVLRGSDTFLNANYDLISWDPQYTYVGYKIVKPGIWGDTIYSVGSSNYYMLSEDLHLYAVWRPTNYKIIYELDGGTNANNPYNYNIESDDINLLDATKKGYNFEGWFTDNAFKNKITSIKNGSFGNLVLYAKYSVITYNIYYVNGTNHENPSSYNVEDNNIVLKDATRIGFGFGGWFADNKYTTKISVFDTSTCDNVTLYAKWEKIYNVSNDGIIIGLTDYGKQLVDLDIPSSIDDITINSIGSTAFANNTYLKSVVLPKSMVNIGSSSFANCCILKSVTIPNSVTSIGNSAFSGCYDLSLINYNATNCQDLSNGNSTFLNAGKNTSGIIVNIGENVERIPNYLFCSLSINVISSSESPARIKDVNFLGNSKCTSIGDYAFYWCPLIKSIKIPASVVSIGKQAFDSNNITDLNVSEDNNIYSSVNGVLLNKNKTSILLCPKGKTSYIVPASVVRIDNGAFAKCTNLITIIFESTNNLTYIGDSAFNKCEKLNNIDIPISVISIGAYAFSGCKSLVSITIPENVTNIGSYAIANCSNLSDVNFNATNCKDFTYQDVTYFFSSSGSNEYGLTINISANVTKIPSYMFYASDYSRIKRINFEANSECISIGDNAFDSCPIIEISMPDSILTIGRAVFNNCTQIESIILSNKLTTIGDFSFANCAKLESIIIPISVINMGSYVFNSCNTKVFCEQETLPETDNWSNGWLYNSSGYEIKSVAYWYKETKPVEEGNFWYYNEKNIPQIWE